MLVGFRARLIEANLDQRLVERTVEVATATKGVGPRALRAALDSSPLWGAGRVEDTYNLLGHALPKALGVIARQQGRGLTEPVPVAVLAQRAGAPVVGGSSLTAALDLDWDDPTARSQALVQVLAVLDARLVELHIDRAYLASTLVRDRSEDLTIYCMPGGYTIPADGSPRPSSGSTSTAAS